MGKHRRPGPPEDAESGEGEREDALAPYTRRRRPPASGRRIHKPLHGHAAHVLPDEPRVLLEWDGFSYAPIGTTQNLKAALDWVNEPISEETGSTGSTDAPA